MLRYKRPTEPADFATTVAPLKLSIAKRIDVLIKKASKQAPNKKHPKTSGKKRARAKKSTIEFENAWKRYKDVFSYAQFEKCGFCESNVTKSGYGDVEHYHPKGELWLLSETGERRTKTVLSEFGYWWLAYDWNNYLFACSKCNQKFKGSYFPVKQKTRRLPPAQQPTRRFPKETPLLLNPYGRVDPGKHLEFELTGLINDKSRSPFGKETIRTCGLNRIQLALAREKKALRALALAQSLAQRNNARNLSVLKDIYELGLDSAEHAGMVRELFRSLGLSWELLVRRYAEEICHQLKTANAAHTAGLEVSLEPMGRERYEHWKLVRNIFEKSSKSTWKSLVQKRAEQLARELLDAQRQGRTPHVNLLEKRFYDMGRESTSSLSTVANIFETRIGQTWADLERAVRKRPTL